jgi:hypothetical protein
LEWKTEKEKRRKTGVLKFAATCATVARQSRFLSSLASSLRSPPLLRSPTPPIPRTGDRRAYRVGGGGSVDPYKVTQRGPSALRGFKSQEPRPGVSAYSRRRAVYPLRYRGFLISLGYWAYRGCHHRPRTVGHGQAGTPCRSPYRAAIYRPPNTRRRSIERRSIALRTP